MLNKALLVSGNKGDSGMARGIFSLLYRNSPDGYAITVSSGGDVTRPFYKNPTNISDISEAANVICDLKVGDVISGLDVKARIGIAFENNATYGTLTVSEVQEGFYLFGIRHTASTGGGEN